MSASTGDGSSSAFASSSSYRKSITSLNEADGVASYKRKTIGSTRNFKRASLQSLDSLPVTYGSLSSADATSKSQLSSYSSSRPSVKSSFGNSGEAEVKKRTQPHQHQRLSSDNLATLVTYPSGSSNRLPATRKAPAAQPKPQTVVVAPPLNKTTAKVATASTTTKFNTKPVAASTAVTTTTARQQTTIPTTKTAQLRAAATTSAASVSSSVKKPTTVAQKGPFSPLKSTTANWNSSSNTSARRKSFNVGVGVTSYPGTAASTASGTSSKQPSVVKKQLLTTASTKPSISAASATSTVNSRATTSTVKTKPLLH
jgi:hypothetical protein